MKTSIQDINSFLISKDEVLKKVIPQVELEPFVSTKNVFHDLLSCTIEQQIHYRSTKKIFKKLLTKAGLENLTPENFNLFEEKSLTDVKLSMQKIETLNNVLLFFESNNHDWISLSNQEVRNQLSSIKGIGDWTIDMILLYTLERDDVFPVLDFHLKKIMMEEYSITNKVKRSMIEIASAWKPYASFATRYLLAYKKYKAS